MRALTSLVVAAATVTSAAIAAAGPVKLTLPQLTARAIAGPRGQMAASDTDAARARVDEANAAQLPKAVGTSFFTISPEIRCVDPACTMTAPAGFAWQFSGVFGGASLTVTQPVYTFGKIANAKDAAEKGVAAQVALEAETQGDIALDAAKAYYGLKLARELRYMLEDGVDQIADAKARMDQRLKDHEGDVTIQDTERVATLLAEAQYQLEDAKAGEEQALAAVRALAAGPDERDVDIDDGELTAVTLTLGDAAAWDNKATQRPQVRAAQDGADAAHALAGFERSQYYPDLAVVGTATWADATGVDRPPSWIYSQPYHQAGLGLALVLRWNIEPWTTQSHVERARAQALHADELAELARIGATLEVRTAYSEAARAKAKMDAATEGEKASRAWVASVLQNDAVGTAEARDIADSYVEWFQMRGRLLQAIMQWDVATVRLRRATGEFKAP